MKTLYALPRVLIISLIFGGIAYAGTFLIKRTYQSQEVLYFPLAGGGNSPIDFLKGGVGGENGNVDLLGGALVSPVVSGAPDTASGIVTSQSAMHFTVDALHLDDAWKMTRYDAYDRLNDWTDAKIDKSGMLDVTSKGESPEQAVQILKTLEGYLNTRSQEMTINVSKQNREFLEKRVAAANHEVNEIQINLEKTMQNSPLADVTDVMKGYFAARDDLQKAEVAEATEEARFDALKSQMAQLLARKNDFANSVSAMNALNANASSLTGEIQKRQLDLDDALANFQPNSPEVLSAMKAVKTASNVSNQIVAAGQQDIKDGLTPDMIQAKSALIALKKSTQSYSKILQDYQASTIKAPHEFAAVERQKMEFENAMKAYGVLRGQLEMARLAENRDPSRFTVLDEPYPNPKPVGPHRGIIAAVVFLLAGLVQLALMSLKEEPVEPQQVVRTEYASPMRRPEAAVEMMEPTPPTTTKGKRRTKV